MRVLLLLVVCWAAWAHAEEAPPAAAGAPTAEERAKALHAEADARRAAIEAKFVAEQKACWNTFLVARCMDEAKQARIEALAAVRRIEQEARALDREKRHRDFEEREARRLEEEPRRAADAAARAEKNRQEQQEILDRIERKRIEAEQRERKTP